MLENVSETARYGGLTVGPKVIDEHVKQNMRKAAERVVSGEFAREWVEEYRSGARRMKELLEELRGHDVELTGKRLREAIKWM